MKDEQSPPDAKHTSAAADLGVGPIAPRSARRVQFLAGLAAALLLAGFVVAHSVRSHSREELSAATARRSAMLPPVDVATVQPGPSIDTVSLPGETAAWYDSMIYARVDGYVGKWFHDIGDRVDEGEVLATIETPTLDAELVAARAKLNAAEAEVQVRQADADFARSTYERWEGSPKGVVSEQERAEKRAGFKSADAKLSAARSNVNLVQADVARLTTLEQFKVVRAPFTGTIVQRRIDIGDLVTAGSTKGNTPLFRMAKDDPIRVFVDAPQALAESMKVGTPSWVRLNDLQNRTFDGNITRTTEAVDPRARTLRVEVDLPNHDDSLVPGLYVQVRFDLQGRSMAQVPAAALVFGDDGPRVAVVDGDDAVRFHKVSIARDNGSTVDLASGVSPGDKVVLNISDQIDAGEKVRPIDDESRLATAAPPALR
jgi:RND family efflux transporter MFP subunit